MLGALIAHLDSKDEAWGLILQSWARIEDGKPMPADWDCFEVLRVACKVLQPLEGDDIMALSDTKKKMVSSCLKHSYPVDTSMVDTDTDIKAEANHVSQARQENIARDRRLSTRAHKEQQRVKETLQRFSVMVNRTYRGFDQISGEYNASLDEDIMDRIAISGLWHKPFPGEEHKAVITFNLLDPSVEVNKAAIADTTGTFPRDTRRYHPLMGPQLSGIYSEKKDAGIFAPMCCQRDVDKREYIILNLFQTSSVGTLPERGDLTTRNDPVVVQVLDAQTEELSFFEFENFVDMFTIDPMDMGCLANGSERGRDILKRAFVREHIVTFRTACFQSAKAGDGLLMGQAAKDAGWQRIKGSDRRKSSKLQGVVKVHTGHRVFTFTYKRVRETALEADALDTTFALADDYDAPRGAQDETDGYWEAGMTAKGGDAFKCKGCEHTFKYPGVH